MDSNDPFYSGLPAPDDDAPPARSGRGRPPARAWEPAPIAERFQLETFRIEQTRECHFKAKPDKKRGCARCGRNKGDACHLGTGRSFNAFGSGANPHAWQGIKTLWQEVLTAKLEAAGFPRGLGHVYVEGRMTFPDRGRRDQGNFRVVLEKAVGDALKDGGWLEDDDWQHYEFGGLAYGYEKGVSRTELLLFPAWPSVAVPADGDQLEIIR